jgi:hypothetical protein
VEYRSAEGPPPGSSYHLDAACRRYLAYIRKNCPGLLPDETVKPGVPVEPIPVGAEQATVLVRTAARQAVARQSGRRGDAPLPDAVVWTDGPDALLVLLDSITLTSGDGLVTVGVDVCCDQARAATGAPRVRCEVDLVVGTEQRPTGLLVAATTPRGPAVIVARWSDALVALAWQALLDTAAALSAATGRDVDGSGLIPSRWTASPAGLTIGPPARHPFDRSPATSRAVDPR